MSEGRKTQVVLLDDRRLEIIIQPKLSAGELLDIVASHFSLKEKEYFGLSFKDDTSHHHWLQLDRKVLEHDFPKKTGPLVLYFSVRFFIESISYLRDNATVELFYLQAKQSIAKGVIECDADTVFELTAHVLQASYGDYLDDATAKKQLKKLSVLPTSVFNEHLSIGVCEEHVLSHYRKLEAQSRGAAIVNYMTIVESLPTYGIHYYEVKDKSSIPWWLGLSYKGISLYDHDDKKVPRRVFAWKQLENLYFRDKKFSIEVHDPKRVVHTLSSFNLYEDAIQEPIEEFDELSDAISDPTTQVSVSRRTFGPGNVNVHAWFAASPSLTKCIWSMAVSQHQFYLDRKQSKSQLPAVRSMSEIAADLCQSTSSLQSSASSYGISRSSSAHSLTLSLSTHNSRIDLTPEELEETRQAQRNMYTLLKTRKEGLEEELRKKFEELRAVCLKEGELTGVLPPEMPLAPGEPLPPIRRRVGTAFALSPKMINWDKATEAEEVLGKLELDLELQDQITKAALKLAHDRSVAKSVRKQRKQQYHKAHQRLKDMEKKLNEFRERVGRLPIKVQSSVEDLSEDSREFLESDSEFISPVTSPAMNVKREVGNHGNNNLLRSDSQSQTQTPQMKIITSPKVEVVEVEPPVPITPSPGGRGGRSTVQYSESARSSQGRTSRSSSGGQQGDYPQHKSAPASPVRQPHAAPPRVSTPSPNPGRNPGGYVANSVYSTRYRNQMYPTFTNRYPGPHPQPDMEVGTPPSPGYRQSENIHNLYNVNSNRTTRYDSTDELKTPPGDDYGGYTEPLEDGQRWPSKHGSLEGAYKKRQNDSSMDYRHYGSLERNTTRHHRERDRDLDLAELSPSKFGSKRESTSDQRDSPYQIVDMPPLPRKDLREHLQEALPGDSGHHYNMQSVPENAYPEYTPHNTSIPYIDSSHSSVSGSNTNIHRGAPWYEGGIRQQAAPHTPQYEAPPTTFVRPEVPEGANNYSPHAGSPGQPQLMTVTKYQSYVEVSKPFEMSDFYKYSERLRKQRLTDHEGSGSQPQSPNRHPPQSPYLSRSSSVNQGQIQPNVSQSRSRPSSPYAQTPYNQDGSYAEYSSVSPSPYSSAPRTHSHPAQYAGGGAHIPNSSVSSSRGSYPQHSPKHVAYQPPQPMTCEPVSRDVQSNKSTPSHRSFNESREMSFGSFNDDGVGDAFTEEMYAWYEGKDEPNQKNATLV